MKRFGCVLAVVTTALVAQACGINELPQYRSEISDVKVEAALTNQVELSVDELPPPDDGVVHESDLILAETEAFIINKLADRLATRLDYEVLSGRFASALVDDMASAFPAWNLVSDDVVKNQGYDTRFLVEVQRYRVHVDELGRATLRLSLEINGWFLPANKRIYQDWHSYEVPLAPSVVGWVPYAGPMDAAQERMYNLMLLNDVPPHVLRETVYEAAEEAASSAIREMLEDSYGS